MDPYQYVLNEKNKRIQEEYMNEMNEKWIKDIRSRMENYSEPLPADLWEKIDADISRPKVIPMWRKWTSVAAAAAVVLAVSTVSLFYWTSEPSLKESNLSIVEAPAIDNTGQKDTPKDVIPEDVKPVVAEVKNDKLLSAVSVKVYDEDESNVDTIEEKQSVAVSDNSPVVVTNDERQEEPTSDMKEEDSSSAKEKRINMMKADRETVRRNASYLAMADDGNGKRRSKMQIGVTTGNIPYSSSSNFSGMSRLGMSTKTLSSANNLIVGEISDATASYTQMLSNNINKETYTDIKHHMPVTVGASVKWGFSENWALETGLNYTYLYSELRSGAKSYIEDEQKLHYVGIPLKVQRSVWSNSIFSFYASAGGMMEKCVSGSLDEGVVLENNKKSHYSEDLNVKPLQFSVLASVGLQANFNKLLSLYLEPGMIYYFDDNTDVLTIRKDKPFNFNLQLGLRFNLGK